MGNHVNQGACGSCYTMSVVQIMQNRLQMKYGKKMPQLSGSFLMNCNYLNEGCNGGWPLFNGFFGEQGYFVTEKCAPYKASTKGQTCSQYEKCQPHSKVVNTGFVGQGYGDATEKKIMKELMYGGAVNGEVKFPRLAGMYSSGIITKEGLVDLHNQMVELAQLTEGQKQRLDDRMASIGDVRQ